MARRPPVSPHRHLQAVHRTSDRLGDRLQYVRLDRNERVTPFPPPVFQDMLAWLEPETFTCYPDTTPFYACLGRQLGLPETHLLLTSGSDGAIKTIFQAYVSPGDRVVMPAPTYGMYYVYSLIFAATPVQVPYEENLVLDKAAFLREVALSPRIVAVPNPDQPTGTIMAPEELREILAAACEVGALGLVDEAYYPFYPHTALDSLGDFPNLVITRTFSKVGGLAGLRLGYVVAAPEIIETLGKVRSAYDVNSVALRLGQYVLEHPQLMDDYAREVEEGREVLVEGLRALGLEAPPSYTNFQLVRVPLALRPIQIVEGLKAQGYLVRWPLGSPVLDQYIRVTLGPAGLMQGFLAALRAVLGQLSAGARKPSLLGPGACP